jgi:hypothetical protein
MGCGDQDYGKRCPCKYRDNYGSIGNDQALREVLERLAGALEKLAAHDRGDTTTDDGRHELPSTTAVHDA